MACGFSGRDDANDVSLLPEAMTDDEYPERRRHSEKNKAIFQVGMIRIIAKESIFVEERRTSFFERNFVFLAIQSVLTLIPLEPH